MPLNFLNEFLIRLPNHPITYSFVNEIRLTNFSPGPIRLHRVPFRSMTFSSSPILLLRVPLSNSSTWDKLRAVPFFKISKVNIAVDMSDF